MKKVVIALLLYLSVYGASAVEKPILKVVSEEWVGITNANGTGTYWDILKAAYGNKYQLQFQVTTWPRAVKMVQSGVADVLVGTYKNEDSSLIFSNHHIDTEYPVYILYDPNHFTVDSLADLSGKLIAGRKGYGFENYLPENAIFYGVDNIQNISRLITNKRIDAALTYSYNLRLADPNSKLVTKELISEKPLYLAFSNNEQGKSLQAEFDNNMSALVASDVLEQYFSSLEEYQHAKLNISKEKKKVNLYLIPKIFDRIQNRLVVIPWELRTSQYIVSEFNDVALNIKQSSYSEVKRFLKENEDSCAFGVRKIEDANEQILFSYPIYVFITPRLFVLKNSAVANKLSNLLINEQFNLTQLLNSYPDLRIVTQKEGVIDKTLRRLIGHKYFKNIFAIDNNSDYLSLIKMIKQDRADTTIVWPSMFFDMLGGDISGQLESFSLDNELGDNLFTYVACNSSTFGKKFIEQVNGMLKQLNHQKNIYLPIIKDMDENSAQVFLKQLELSHIQ